MSFGPYRLSLDELLLSGQGWAVEFARAVQPYRDPGHSFPVCDHLMVELERGEVVATLCVLHPDRLLCTDCGNRHLDSYEPPVSCIECGGTEDLAPIELVMTLGEGSGSLILTRVAGPWICRGCRR